MIWAVRSANVMWSTLPTKKQVCSALPVPTRQFPPHAFPYVACFPVVVALLITACSTAPTSSTRTASTPTTTNTNYALLGLIAQKIEGEPLAQSLQNRLFAPLFLQYALLPPLCERHPRGLFARLPYGSSSSPWRGEPPYSPKEKAAAQASTSRPNDYTDVNHSFAMAAIQEVPSCVIGITRAVDLVARVIGKGLCGGHVRRLFVRFFGVLQAFLFDGHIGEFVRVEDLAAFQTFDKFGIFFAR